MVRSKRTKRRTLSSQVSVFCLIHSLRSFFRCPAIASAFLLSSSRQPLIENFKVYEKALPHLDSSKFTRTGNNFSSQVSVSCLVHSPRSFFICTRIPRAFLLSSSRQPHNRINKKKFRSGNSDEPDLESKVDRKFPGQMGSQIPNMYTPLVIDLLF